MIYRPKNDDQFIINGTFPLKNLNRVLDTVGEIYFDHKMSIKGCDRLDAI